MIARLLTPLALLLAAPVMAQQSLPRPQPVQAVPLADDVHPALWQVSDADTTIYLFGTIHLLPKGLDWFKGPLAQAFARADELVTEIPEIDPQSSQAVLMRRGILPAGQSLRDQMSARERALFEQTLGSFGLPAGQATLAGIPAAPAQEACYRPPASLSAAAHRRVAGQCPRLPLHPGASVGLACLA